MGRPPDVPFFILLNLMIGDITMEMLKIMDINRETIISEILTNFPEAMPKFQELGMHCLGCALATAESLEQACAAHGVDPDEFIVELKAYLLAL